MYNCTVSAPATEIWNIFRYGKSLVFQSKNELFIVQNSRKIVRVPSKYRIDYSANINNKVIVATHQGVFTLKGNSLVPLGGTEIMIGKTVRSILPIYNKVMFVTNSSGLFLYNGVATTPFTADFSPLLVSEQIFCAATNGKYVAFGTVRKGVVMKNLTNGVTSYANVFTGLQNNTVLSMAFDRTGNLWLGLDNGVSYMMTEMPYSSLLDVRNSNGTGYASQVYGDKLYLGTNQGLFFTAYPPQYSYMPPSEQTVEGITGQNFNMVYNNFMMKLDQNYPDLKLIDKKLCAYLRMGLSSKEMAQLLNTSERSIETVRYRLRKKLGIGSGENLSEFIKNFETTD